MNTKILLVCLLFISKISFTTAQGYFPSVYDFPETGFYKVRADNGYILGYSAQNNDTTNWVLASRYLRSNAPNIDYTGKDIYSERENNVWVDRTTILDSFIVENGTIKEVFKWSKYNYPGYVQNQIYRYVFSYDSEKKLIAYNSYISQNGNPSTLSIYSKTYITYGNDNKRKKDSIVYSSSPTQTTLVYYTYDIQGNPIFEASIIRGDTAYKASFTYQNDKMITSNRWQFNTASYEWSLNNSDSFTYNAQGLLSKNIRYGIYFSNGQIGFSKFTTQYYEYNENNKLTEMRAFNEFRGEFTDAVKSVFYYSPNNKAYLGYDYSGDSIGNWSPKASVKYLFDFLSSASTAFQKSNKVSLFPNPANTFLELAGLDEANSIQLTDMQGKTFILPVISNQIDLNNLASGMYFAVIRNNQQILHSQKLMIQHY